MNQIIKAALNAHRSEYAILEWEEKDAFEHFINRCIVNKHSIERFDPSDIMTEEGEIGLDGIAIILNGHLFTTLEEVQEYYTKNSNVEATFVFIQAKSGDHFNSGEMSTFFRGIKHFFEKEDIRPTTNEKIELLISIKDYVFKQTIEQESKPFLVAYFACCGSWNQGNNLTNCIKTEKEYFINTADFANVEFNPIDNNKIIILYKELRRKISKTISMQKKMSFYPMEGVSQAYFGLVACKDIVELLKDDNGELFNNIFEDNVRDFQGYNLVNKEIEQTVCQQSEQSRFAVLNNGITILAKEVKPDGDNITIFDYQIVNGCQTSRVLFDNRIKLNDNSYVLVKMIQVEDENTLEQIVYTTNRQTEVKSEAFASSKKFHKKLEEHYKSIDIDYRLYYERRSKQYDQSESINKNKVISLATQVFSYVAMFLNEPQSVVSRYYGELLSTYSNKIFIEDSHCDPYYISAYTLFLVEDAIKKNKISIQYKKFKFYLTYAIKVLISGNKIYRANSRELKKSSDNICAILCDEKKFLDVLQTAHSCLEEAKKLSIQVDAKLLNRSKVLTDNLTQVLEKYVADKNSMFFLYAGVTVQCFITAIREYAVSVELRTTDERNRGSIHISQVAKRYIEDLNLEFKVGQDIQAKILKDNYYETNFGWSLTTIL